MFEAKVFLIPVKTLEGNIRHILKSITNSKQTFPFPMLKHENMKKFSTHERLFDELRADFWGKKNLCKENDFSWKIFVINAINFDAHKILGKLENFCT